MSVGRCPVCPRPARAQTLIDAACLTASQLDARRREHPDAAPIEKACRLCQVESRGTTLAGIAKASGLHSQNAGAADVAEALRRGSLITADSRVDEGAHGNFAHRLPTCVISQIGRWRYVFLPVTSIINWQIYNQFTPLLLPPLHWH